MGVFKALITVAHKDTEYERREFIMRKLQQIRAKLGEIYTKQFKKPFPIQEGFFCENLGAS